VSRPAQTVPWYVCAAILCMAAGLPLFPQAHAAPQTLMACEFNTRGDLERWVGSNHVTHPRVTGGVLTLKVLDRDPFISHRVFDKPLPATPTQAIEVRMNAPTSGIAEFFWTGTPDSPYGGFYPGKETRFEIRPGWHVYRVMPYWQGEKQIVRIRLDLPGIVRGSPSRTYQIDYIRIVDVPRQQPVKADWDFAEGIQGWRVDGERAPYEPKRASLSPISPGAHGSCRRRSPFRRRRLPS
jgi:hypothetical protein